MPHTATVRDVGPRDGFQAEDRIVASADKLRLIEVLVTSRVPCIEATSFVHPKAIPQLTDAEAVVERLPRDRGTRFSALVPNRRGAERALATGIDEITVFLSASEAHNRENVRQSVEQSLAAAAEVAQVWSRSGRPLSGVIATSFGCPFTGDVPARQVLAVALRLAAVGCNPIFLGDTIGKAQPMQVRDLVRRLQDALPTVRFGLHFHNTYGRALANVFAGLQCGVDLFDGAVGGMGGCPYAPGASGNVATEDIVSMLHAMGIETGIDLAALRRAGHLAETLVGRTLPSALLRVQDGGVP